MKFIPIDIDAIEPVETEAPAAETPKPLRESAQSAIDHFLDTLDGQSCSELYDMVLAQVEEPLLLAVMRYTNGNQSRASEMLGLNRGTLRKKLRRYGLLDGPEPTPTTSRN